MQNTLEELETTVKTKDEIIQMFLEEQKNQQEETKALEEELERYEKLIRKEELKYRKRYSMTTGEFFSISNRLSICWTFRHISRHFACKASHVPTSLGHHP